MIMPQFDIPWMLPVALVLALLAAIATTIWARRRRRRVSQLGGQTLLSRLVPAATTAALGWRGALLTVAVLFSGVALAGPRWGQERAVVQASGIDMVIAMDASLSMLATDERPNRLERAKAEVRRLRSLSPGDRVALLAFAGRSYILTPLTLDDAALDLYLDNLEPSVVGQAGSSLAATLRQGTELLLATKTGSDRALVVFTDAEVFEDEADMVAAARHARDNDVNVVMVGFGTTRGSTIPVTDERGRPSQKRDEHNVIVMSRHNPELLAKAAAEAGGIAIRADESDKAGRIRTALANLRRERRAVSSTDLLQHRFQLFLLPALLLIMLDTWLGERRGRRRRASAAAAVAAGLLLAVTPSVARADDAADGVRALRAGRHADAVMLLRRAVDGGDRRLATLYNYGTALIATDSLAAAAEVLERAAQNSEGELRYRALFNLGLAHLRRGIAAQGDSAQQLLVAALETYKRVLLMRPADGDAKWNYELALRRQRGGGGGGGGSSQSQGGGGQQAPEPEPAGGVGSRQAEQILNSAARDERDVQGRRMRRNRPEIPPGGRDW